MGNEDNVREPEIQIVEVRRVIPNPVERPDVRLYLRNMPKPVYNVRTKPKTDELDSFV